MSHPPTLPYFPASFNQSSFPIHCPFKLPIHLPARVEIWQVYQVCTPLPLKWFQVIAHLPCSAGCQPGSLFHALSKPKNREPEGDDVFSLCYLIGYLQSRVIHCMELFFKHLEYKQRSDGTAILGIIYQPFLFYIAVWQLSCARLALAAVAAWKAKLYEIQKEQWCFYIASVVERHLHFRRKLYVTADAVVSFVWNNTQMETRRFGELGVCWVFAAFHLSQICSAFCPLSSVLPPSYSQHHQNQSIYVQVVIFLVFLHKNCVYSGWRFKITVSIKLQPLCHIPSQRLGSICLWPCPSY